MMEIRLKWGGDERVEEGVHGEITNTVCVRKGHMELHYF